MREQKLHRHHMLDLTEGSIGRGIFAFAVPVLLGNLFQLFYSLADTRIVGSALGESALASVGATSVLCNLVTGFMNGMALGFAIPVSRGFGAGNRKLVKKTAGNIVALGGMLTIGFTLLFFLFRNPFLRWMNISAELYENADIYIRIIIGGMFATFAYNAGAGILRAVGDTLAPLLFLVISSILNVMMDFWFIYGFHMGVAGAAYATVIAQIISGILCWSYMLKRYEMFRICAEDLLPDEKCMKELFTSGFSMACMSSLVQFGTVALQTAINTLGQNIIVAHTAARKATELFMMPFSVMGSTMATFAGQNYGAGRYSRIRRGICLEIVTCSVWCVFVFLCARWASEWMIYAVTGTNTSEILETGALYLKVDTCLYMITAFICVLRNALQGIGDHITPIVSSFLELAGKVFFAKMMTPMFGYWGIIWAEPVSWAIMVIPLGIQVLRSSVLRKENQ